MAPLFSCRPAASVVKALPGPQTRTSNMRTPPSRRKRSLLALDDFGVMCFLLSNEFIFSFRSPYGRRSEAMARPLSVAPFSVTQQIVGAEVHGLRVVQGCIREKFGFWRRADADQNHSNA